MFTKIMEKMLGQACLYYAIDVERTDFHPLYGEAINKTFLPPVRVFVLLEWEDPGYTGEDEFGPERRTKVTVHFHKRRLTEDQNIFVRVGDFLEYGDNYYEIVSLSEPKQLFGQTDYKLEIAAKCVRARSGVFNAK